MAEQKEKQELPYIHMRSERTRYGKFGPGEKAEVPYAHVKGCLAAGFKPLRPSEGAVKILTEKYGINREELVREK